LESRLTIRPRFSETDALGHINNTVAALWFEEGRLHLCFEEAKITQKTVLAKLEINYIREVHFGEDIEVVTSVTRLGNSSITYEQKISQGNEICLDAQAVAVTYDSEQRTSMPISEDSRNKLHAFLRP
jgi:acyl-CoA thioester hydrolase